MLPPGRLRRDPGPVTEGAGSTQSSKDGVTGTPTVRVNGTPLEQPTREAVSAAVEAAG